MAWTYWNYVYVYHVYMFYQLQETKPLLRLSHDASEQVLHWSWGQQDQLDMVVPLMHAGMFNSD